MQHAAADTATAVVAAEGGRVLAGAETLVGPVDFRGDFVGGELGARVLEPLAGFQRDDAEAGLREFEEERGTAGTGADDDGVDFFFRREPAHVGGLLHCSPATAIRSSC